jgi:SAM-dependent methyltransferase
MSAPPVTTSSESWTSHYEALDDGFVLFAHEAQDYFERLAAAVTIRRDTSVLDFGCGFGYVAELVGRVAGELYVWDVAANMRERTQRRVGRARSVHVLALDPWPAKPPVSVDLVLVNSVAQYLTREELRAYLARWRDLLAPGGRIVLSDLITPRSGFVGEVVDSLAFAARRGFLWKSLAHAAGQLGVYLRARRSLPLLRLDESELRHDAAAAGLEATILDRNLTYRRNRFTALLARAQ